MLGGPTGDGRVYRKVIVLNRYDLVEANDISRHDGVVEKMKNRTTRIQYMTWFVFHADAVCYRSGNNSVLRRELEQE